LEASGFDVEREVQEVVEGGENRFVHRLPTKMRHGNLVLKRGFLGRATPLFTWCKTTMESELEQRIGPRDIKVSLLDLAGHPMVAWDFVRAWPVKMSVSNFNAKENEIAIETLEFSYAYLNRGFVPGNLGQGA
ncbi:MAG: phage tail protein, partial [Hyphomicrobiales bacterium]|nr:phage tail protein [Hyphomicrobiales bacterium]